MSQIKKYQLQEDPWSDLKAFTAARIALGKTGVSIPLKEALAFKQAHAQARDAVFSQLDLDEICLKLEKTGLPVYPLHSQATDRNVYLQRPDLGRKLHQESDFLLKSLNSQGFDICICIADGLSSLAVQQNACPLLEILIPALQTSGFKLAPLALIEQGRVAIADEVGALLKARLSIILIGERPGLTAADSLGAYLTFQPMPGLTDESRNCISNIRPEGLVKERAAAKILHLITEAFRYELTGVGLKDTESTLLSE